MYEKNCLNYGFTTHVQNADYVIVLQMHPSSQQERAYLFDKIYSIDMDASIHAIHAHTLHTQDHLETNMLLTAVKGPSCIIVCETYEKFVSLLQMFGKASKKTSLPCTVTGAQHFDKMLNPADIAVLANKSLQWEDVLEMTHTSCCMVGSLHVHGDTCMCNSLHEALST